MESHAARLRVNTRLPADLHAHAPLRKYAPLCTHALHPPPHPPGSTPPSSHSGRLERVGRRLRIRGILPLVAPIQFGLFLVPLLLRQTWVRLGQFADCLCYSGASLLCGGRGGGGEGGGERGGNII